MSIERFHCPYRQSSLLQQALAPNKMRIGFMLGAGCPTSIRIIGSGGSNSPLIPDIAGLTRLVSEELGKDDVLGPDYKVLLARLGGGVTPNIEGILSHLRALVDVVRTGHIDGLDLERLKALDSKICALISSVVGADLPEEENAYHHLASWISGIARSHPIEIFTPNYDLLAEQALESRRVPYFDGFVGAREAFFDLPSMEDESLPARWARVWKLHGSINWWRTTDENVIRKSSGDKGERHMIYPSHLKYDQSRRLPYLAMLDRLRDFLKRGQAVLVCSGYSFADQHLNEVIMNGLRGNPTAMCFGLLFGPLSGYVEAINCAVRQPNLSLLAADGGVLGTLNRNWHGISQESHPLHELAVGPAAPSADGTSVVCKFELGDFARFGQFLASQLNSVSDMGESYAP